MTVHVVNNVVNDVEIGLLGGQGQGFQFHNSIDTLEVTGNHLTNIEQYGMWVAPVTDWEDYPAGSISFNQIDTGGLFGINGENGAFAPTNTLNAECNYWGDSTGPFNATNNSSGLGDPVTDLVDFDPFLTNKGKMKAKCP